jgi:lycopene cyclase domain-containing protein
VSLVYLVGLLGALACMAAIDRRFGLFFWRDARRAAAVLLPGLAFFVVWDFLGIRVGIFSLGVTRFMTGVLVAPQFPLEEIVFLTFLCYLTMVLIAGFERLWSRRRRADR